MDAVRASLLAEAVYKNDNTGIPSFKTFEEMGFTNYREIIVKEEYAIVAENGKECVVVVRGSDDWKDWKDNLSFVAKERSVGKVHIGFWDSACQLQAPCFEAIKELGYRYIDLVFIGHSKGAAVAEILCVKWALMYKNKLLKFFSFGSPKVGWKSYVNTANKLGIEAYCFNGTIDPVPKEPTWFFFMPSIFYKYTFKQIAVNCFHLIGEYVKAVKEYCMKNKEI